MEEGRCRGAGADGEGKRVGGGRRKGGIEGEDKSCMRSAVLGLWSYYAGFLCGKCGQP